MNPNQMIHETVIRDIIDAYDMIKDDTVENFKDRNKLSSMRSIASASSGLTLTFPLLGSRANSIESLAMVAKAQERKCVTMLQMLFSAIQITDAGDAFKYLSQFHNNLSTRFFTVDDAINIMARIGESAPVTSTKRVKEAARIAQLEKAVAEDCRLNTDFRMADNISETAINEYKVVNTPYNRTIVHEAKPSKIPYASKKDKYDFRTPPKMNTIGNYSRFAPPDFADFNAHLQRVEDMKAQEKEENKKRHEEEKAYERAGEDQKRLLARNKDEREKIKLADDLATSKSKRAADALKGYETMYNFNKNMLMDSDVRKANELMPTMLNVAFKTKTEDGGIAVIDNVVCGVKCKLYPIDSDDVIDHIRTKHNDRNVILGLVRASTREISFWKDLVFAIDRAKLDALSYSKKSANSKLWKVLERRALKSRIRRTIGNGNDASAISTLAISQNEVEYLRKEDNIDVEDIRVARNLMESYNLMSIVIIDEDLEVCKFIYDTGEDLWETITFNHLERESSDNTYKRIVNMMTKMR
jgi:hypothetical protein